jgi:hypothetical protein
MKVLSKENNVYRLDRIIVVGKEELACATAIYLHTLGFSRTQACTPGEIDDKDVHAASCFIFFDKADKTQIEKRVYEGWYLLENYRNDPKAVFLLDEVKSEKDIAPTIRKLVGEDSGVGTEPQAKKVSK